MKNKTTGIMTFAQKNGRPAGTIGSSVIRGEWLADKWKEAEIFTEGKKFDVIIFQKVYWNDYAKEYDGIKILDLCDPDFLSSDLEFKKLEQNMDAITCASEELYKFIKQIADKPVYYVPDRVNLDIINKQKEHVNLAKTVGWFGYHHNAKVVLPQILSSISKLGLKLMVISDGDYKPKESANIEVENRPFLWDTFMYDMMDCDIIMNPRPFRQKRFKYKSNNKTIISWAMGIPVADTLSDLKRFMNPEERKKEAVKRLKEVKENYSMEQSIKQFKDIIKICEKKKR